MIVQYNHPPKNLKRTGTSGLVKGQKYHVLDINFNYDRNLQSCVVLDEDSLPLVAMKYFDIVFGDIPSGWSLQADTVFQSYHLSPKAFEGHFWEDFHNGTCKAEKIFFREYQKIVDFHAQAGFHLPENDASLERLIEDHMTHDPRDPKKTLHELLEEYVIRAK